MTAVVLRYKYTGLHKINTVVFFPLWLNTDISVNGLTSNELIPVVAFYYAVICLKSVSVGFPFESLLCTFLFVPLIG